MKAIVFPTCLIESLYPDVAASVIRVLAHYGVDASVMDEATCCGQAFFNAGMPEKAASVAAMLDRAIVQSDVPVIIPSGSCASFVKKRFNGMFDPKFDYASRCFEFAEFLTRKARVTVNGELSKPAKVAYHPSCHSLRELGLYDEVRAMLGGINGLELVPVHKDATCCGFGGVFSAACPELSLAMAQDKADAVIASGADILVSLDAGCQANISGRLKGSGVRAMHLAELLLMAIEG